MINRKITPKIDTERCIGCGLCVPVCPLGTISIKDSKAVITGEESISCGHCAAACPTDAITVESNNETFEFSSFRCDNRWIHHGEYDIAGLVNLMRSRRSCRNFSDKPVDKAVLDDLIKIGITAPSGTNAQQWRFTVLPDRKSVVVLGDLVRDFFKKLNKTVEIAPLRVVAKWFGYNELDEYYQYYYRKVKESITEYETKGKDRLFHGATSAILIGSTPDASTPIEDSSLASQNILLAAHAMGLGTCLIGYVVEAMEREAKIKYHLGIPPEENIHSVIAIGYSKEKYQRSAGRKKVEVRHVSF